MLIILKNKDTLIFDEFKFRCCIGKNGFSKKKVEGDKKTPTGLFSLGHLYYRADKKEKPDTIKGDFIKSSFLTSTMGISYKLGGK